MEGVHFRNSSTDGVIRHPKIYDTGDDGAAGPTQPAVDVARNA